MIKHFCNIKYSAVVLFLAIMEIEKLSRKASAIVPAANMICIKKWKYMQKKSEQGYFNKIVKMQHTFGPLEYLEQKCDR